MSFTYGAMTQGSQKERYVFIEINGQERALTPEEAERMAISLIIYASDVRLGRSTNKEEIRQYCKAQGEPDPFPDTPEGK